MGERIRNGLFDETAPDEDIAEWQRKIAKDLEKPMPFVVRGVDVEWMQPIQPLISDEAEQD